MSETALAGIRNSYAQSRNQSNAARTDAMGDLMQALLEKQSAARQAFDAQAADDEKSRLNVQLQLQQALANNVASILAEQIKRMF